jgi:hypothetical protein
MEESQNTTVKLQTKSAMAKARMEEKLFFINHLRWIRAGMPGSGCKLIEVNGVGW